MSNPSVPTLKRPRSTSTPPSPSSTSSPKRAASEDPFPSSSDSGRGNDFLTPNMQAGNAASSPLRLDFHDEPEQAGEGESGWVRRTEEVHLSSDGVDDGRERLRGQYNELLASLPPPYVPWQQYFIIPAPLLNALKTLALDDPSSSKTGVETSDLCIDLTPFLKDEQGEEVYVIETEDLSDVTSLVPKGKKKRIWAVKDGLLENDDFVFVSSDGWQKLLSWYGPYDGPSLARFCMPGERIQMAPPIYTLYLVKPTGELGPVSSTEPPPSESPALHPTRLTCPSDAEEVIFLHFLTSLVADELGESPMRLWTIDASSSSSDASTLPALKAFHLSPTLLPILSGRLIEPSQNLRCAEAGFANGDVLAIEVGKQTPLGVVWSVDVNEHGKAVEKVASVPTAPAPLFSNPAFFPGPSNATASTSASTNMQTRSQSRGGSRKGKGLVGLVNLGNTCFMNSAVQCLSNTQELSEYFLSGVYREELNPDNPLGMHGQIAEAFGGTVETLWAASSSQASYSPRQLKMTTSRFAPQFAGYGQHDTQEFIAFLLDGLHEDLNRIKKKPYIEKPDWKPGGGDVELAELGRECWEGYKKRNDSVIVDLFQGQLRSTLVCPECHKESITMDPFMYLTVPLPIAQHREIRLHLIPRDPELPPVRVRLLVPQNASFMQVKEKLGTMVKCKASNLLGFDLWKSGVYAWFSDADHNSEAKDSDAIVFHELAAPVSASRKTVGTASTDGSVTVPVYTFRSIESSRNGYRQEPSECALQPFFITLSKTEATDPIAVREAIVRGYQRFIRPEIKSQFWVPSGSSPAADTLSQAEDEGSVAEIHLNGGQAKVVEVPARSSISSMSIDAPTNDMNGAHPNGSTFTVHTIGSAKSGKLVPRGDLFKVHVADASTADGASGMTMFKTMDNVVPLYRGSISSASGQWSRLEHRRKAKKNMFGQIANGIKSIVGSYGSDEEGSPPNTPVSPPLVIRPGEGIFCEWQSRQFLEYFDSAEEEEEVIDPAIAKELAKKTEGRTISIEDCLDEFSREETLGQDDLWYCPQCKKHQAATKKLEIYKAPDILVICIKRFGSSRRLSDKLDNLVNFPIDGLDLEERIGERKVARSLKLSEEVAKKYGIEDGMEPMMYDLYAVDNHFGGMGGGHYTAFCRNKEDREWYNYDDSRVSKANVEAVQSRAAYLLFYRRRTQRPIGGISRLKAEEASRAASPMSPSSNAGPSTLPNVLTACSAPSSTPDSDRLPSYSPPTPAMPSPVLSAAPDSDYELDTARSRNLQNLGAGIGFGNTAWGPASMSMRGSMPGVRHPFGSDTPTDTSSEVDNSTSRPMGLLSPPESDDGFERIPAQPGGASTEISGLGEDYEVVRPDSGGSAEAGMVSARRSPGSDAGD